MNGILPYSSTVFKTTQNATCEQSWFSSIGDYVKCTDALKANGVNMKPPRPDEIYLLDIDLNNTTHVAAILTLCVLLIHPVMLIANKWKSLEPGKPVIGIMLLGLGVFLPNTLVLVYVAAKVDLNYLKAHYEHIGHPPLYGDMPPLNAILNGWIISACFELIVIVLFGDRDDKWRIIAANVNVIDRFLCVFYWQNLTCLCRILTGVIANVTKIVVFPGNHTARMYVTSGYYVFNIIHMAIYIWRGVTNTINTTEVVTTSWFVIPSAYQQFAVYQMCMLVIEWILSFITYRYQTSLININIQKREETMKQD